MSQETFGQEPSTKPSSSERVRIDPRLQAIVVSELKKYGLEPLTQEQLKKVRHDIFLEHNKN